MLLLTFHATGLGGADITDVVPLPGALNALAAYATSLPTVGLGQQQQFAFVDTAASTHAAPALTFGCKYYRLMGDSDPSGV